MKYQLKLIVAMALAMMAPFAVAQTNGAGTKKPVHRKRVSKAATPPLETQMRQMRGELQDQIDGLKRQLGEKDARIQSLQQTGQAEQQLTAAAAEKAATAAEQSRAVSAALQQNNDAVNGLQNAVAELHAADSSTAAAVQQAQAAETQIQHAVEQPEALHYKAVTIAPGGFVAGESVWRQRAMNADIYTNFNATPYMNSGEAHTSEWVPSARQSRLSTLVSGKAPFGIISGYFEADFLSSGTTSNNLQSNSYTLRIRQAWAQAAAGHTTLTAGQMWTLLTEDKKGTQPGQEALPLFFDGNLHVGYTYARQLGFRLQQAITPGFTLAIALENSQYQFSASNAPTNFFFGAAGASGGLNNPSANYTNQVAPDVLVKAAFDPGYGHYEIGGVARFFRDRYYPVGATAAGAANDTELGGGFVANARFPVTPKADLGLHLVAGDGTGRYGPALLPDVTVKPGGELEPIRNAQGLFSLELHPSKRLDIFGYAGTEYAQRTYYRNGSGVLVGYAPPTASNTGCNIEQAPTSNSGYAPGASTCNGATRAVMQGSGGWVYRAYSGPAGRLQYGLAYSYLTRDGWAGVGGAPKAVNNMVYTSVRYYLP